MFSEHKLTDFFIRTGIGLLIGVIVGFAISEISYLLMPNKVAPRRGPQQIEYVIPAGTAQKIENGAFISVLPEGMQFVQGDVLLVKNEDSAAHQMGPLFIPPDTTSQLLLDTVNSYSYSCSFESNQYVGLTVQPRVTLATRLRGILAIGLPSGMMLMVYSYLIPPDKLRWKKKSAPD